MTIINPNKRPLGWGFIGASNIAAEHMVSAVRKQAGNQVVAVASASLDRARAFADKLQIAGAYDSAKSLLADPAVDVVYVSSTNELHCEQVLLAASAGKHVLCEKPLALTVSDAVTMANACRDAGVVMATNHHLRNAATHRKLQELLKSGAIGRPLFARVFHAVFLPDHLQGWRLNRPGAGGGVILDITVHDVDALRFILDAEPVEATALAQRSGMAREGLEDGVMAVLRFDNGVLAQLHDAFTVKYARTGIEIHGESGSLIGRDIMTQRATGEVLVRDASGERVVPVDHENLYERGVAAFCAAIEGGGSPAATAEDGIRSLAASIAISEACLTGRSVHIPTRQGEDSKVRSQ